MALSLLQFPRAYSFYRITLLMVLLLVFASEDSLHFFIPAKHLNHIELAVLVSKCVGLYPATDRFIKSFIIYLLPLFVITSKRIFRKIQMYKTTKENIYWNAKHTEIFIDNSRTKITNWNAEKNRCNKEGKLLRQKD